MTVKEFKIQYALGSMSVKTKLKLAENPKTFGSILTILSRGEDEDKDVLYHVRHNPNTPKRIVNQMKNKNIGTVTEAEFAKTLNASNYINDIGQAILKHGVIKKEKNNVRKI